MKSLFIACLCLSIAFTASSQSSGLADTSKLVLLETMHDFGKIPQGKPAVYNFVVKNNDSAPLSLTDVHASCGCTTPEWDRKPIAPGETAIIKVGYNAAAAGAFTKSVSITYGDKVSKSLIIKGEVWKIPTTSAPENASLGFLKQQSL